MNYTIYNKLIVKMIVWHKETDHFLKHLATVLSYKWDKASDQQLCQSTRVAFAGFKQHAISVFGSLVVVCRCWLHKRVMHQAERWAGI